MGNSETSSDTSMAANEASSGAKSATDASSSSESSSPVDGEEYGLFVNDNEPTKRRIMAINKGTDDDHHHQHEKHPRPDVMDKGEVSDGDHDEESAGSSPITPWRNSNTKRTRSTTDAQYYNTSKGSHRDKRARKASATTTEHTSNDLSLPKTRKARKARTARQTTPQHKTSAVPARAERSATPQALSSPSSATSALHPFANAADIDLDSKCIGKRQTSQDPTNRFITQQRLRLQPWEAIVGALNEHARAAGAKPKWTQAGVYGRFVRNGPRVVEAAGFPAFNTSAYMHLRVEDGEPAMRKLQPLPTAPVAAVGDGYAVSLAEGASPAVLVARSGAAAQPGRGIGAAMKAAIEGFVGSEQFRDAMDAVVGNASNS